MSQSIEELEEKIRNKTITPHEIVVYMALLDDIDIDIDESEEEFAK
jgi:hypothetical protein